MRALAITLNRSTGIELPNYKHPHLSAVLYFVKDQPVIPLQTTGQRLRRCREAELYAPIQPPSSVMQKYFQGSAPASNPEKLFVAFMPTQLPMANKNATPLLDPANITYYI